MLFKKIILAVFAFSLVSTSFAGIPGYVTDSQGKLVRDAAKRCVKTGTWKPENMIPECDTNPKKVQPDNGNSHSVDATQFKDEAPLVQPLKPAPAITEQPLAAPAKNVEIKKAIPVILDAAVMFDFDKSNLTEVGKEILNSFVTALNATEYKTINLDGYTDRFGSNSYNQKLSQNRANAVKAFLVANGVDAKKIVATGRGKSNFKTKPTDCKNHKKAALKACYAPDRRVVVTVN